MPKSKMRKRRPTRGYTAKQDAEHTPRSRPGRSGYYRYREASRGGSADFDWWMTSTWTVRWTLVVTAVAVCAAVLFGFLLNARERDAHALENASTCATGQTVDCLLDLPVTIQDRGRTGDKDTTYYLDVSGLDPFVTRVDLPGQTALWNAVVEGDGATAVLWNGTLVRIEDNGVEGDTSHAPAVTIVVFQGLLVSSLIWILTSLSIALRISAVNRGLQEGWTRLLVPVLILAIAASVFFPFGAVVGQQEESIAESMAVGGGLTALAGLVALFQWLRNR